MSLSLLSIGKRKNEIWFGQNCLNIYFVFNMFILSISVYQLLKCEVNEAD